MYRKMYEKKFYVLIVVLVISTICTAITITTQTTATAQLTLEPPTNPNVILNGPPVNFTADQEDRDIAIDPLDDLPSNGTVSISTFGATDMDINDFPPVGVSVIIQNDTVTVTNQSVTIGGSFAAESLESSDDSSTGISDGNGDGNGNGGSSDEE